MKTSEVLHAAADRIEHGGLWQGDAEICGPGQTCAGNAVFYAGNKDASIYISAQRALWEYLGGTHLSDIFDWNDAAGRTAAEVVEVLRACAVIEAAKETADERVAVTA